MPKPTIYTWVCLKKIPPPCIIKLGRTLRFDLEAVDRWVNDRRGVAEASALGCIQSER
jgi:predicted DNA-binding transcriptional regulator AlpA